MFCISLFTYFKPDLKKNKVQSHHTKRQ